MAKISKYEDLIAWQQAYAIVIRVYETTKTFPKDEQYGLTQQVRRAAVSVPSNIAERFGRYSRPDYLRFLDMARGSTYELQTQMRIAHDLGYAQDNELLEKIEELERVLNGLIRSLRSKT